MLRNFSNLKKNLEELKTIFRTSRERMQSPVPILFCLSLCSEIHSIIFSHLNEMAAKEHRSHHLQQPFSNLLQFSFSLLQPYNQFEHHL